jgi:hypothetical protein
VQQSPIDRVAALAQQRLVVPINESANDTWLWEHAERVQRLAQMLTRLPEIDAENVDLAALQAAALFHDAGWTVEFQQGRWKRWQLLGRPTNDIQRELGAAMLQEEAGHMLPALSARRAADAIRACNDRKTENVEAQLLAEAEALDEIGTLYLLRQFRQYQAEGRPLLQLVESWQRQQEYHFWDLRLNEGLRFEATRDLARQRLGAVDAFMNALGSDLAGADVQALVDEGGDDAAAEQTG